MFRFFSSAYMVVGRHDIQQNDIQHYDTQHNNIQHYDTQHIDIQHYDTLHNDIYHNNKLNTALSIMVECFYAEFKLCLWSQISTLS